MSGQIPDFKKFRTPYFFIISDIFQTFYGYTGQFPNSFGDKFRTFFFRRVGIAELEVEIGEGLKIPLKVEVIESRQMDLILGTDLLKYGIIDMKEGLLTIRVNNEEYEIPIDFDGQNKEDETSSDDTDSENSEESEESEDENDGDEYEEGNENELFLVLEEEQRRKGKKSVK